MTNEQTVSTTTKWTEFQAAAIAHDGGDLLVSAAAGSGKTAVLAERCARLVCEGTADGRRCGVENLLVLTFTEAAANEMRRRIARAIREKVRRGRGGAAGGSAGLDAETLQWLNRQAAMVDRASISTLHAFCARVLRQHFHEAGLDPNFEVLDEDEAGLLRDEVLNELLAKKHRLPAEGATAEAARGFTDFFEAYAQGRDSNCRGMILTLHNMLASTADRAVFLAKARGLYSAAGAAETFEGYVKQVAAEELRLLLLRARRACAWVKAAVGPGPMFEELSKKCELIDGVHDLLLKKGAAEWLSIHETLAAKWPTLTTLKTIDDFEGLKEATWEAVKKGMKDLRDRVFSADPAVMLAELPALAAPLETLIGLAEEFDQAFAAAKRSQHRLDFNDLERLTKKVLEEPGALALQELRQRYHYLLIDEFQDINPLQEALLQAVSSPGRYNNRGNLFLVGDVKQSIYGFRLAEPKLFLEKERAWQAASTENSRKFIALPHNFRSRAKLLATMNGLFARLLTPEVAGVDYPAGHALVAGKAEAPPANGFDGAPVEMRLVVMDRSRDDAEAEKEDDDEDFREMPPPENLSPVEHEARMVADRVAELLAQGRHVAGRGGAAEAVRARDIAILLRSVKSKALIFSRALARRGIKAHADLSTGYFDAPEVRETMALLQVLDNPRQDIPLSTVLLGPFGRFSHDDLALIRLSYAAKEVPFAEAAATYGGESAATFGQRAVQDYSLEPPPLDEALAGRLRVFFAKLARWRDVLHVRPLHEGLAEIFAESKILVYVSAELDGRQRVANLQMLHQYALKFAGFRKQGLHRFLRFIERLRASDAPGAWGGGGDFGEAPTLSEASDVVRIMSVHKAKGLEFPVVFVSGLGGKFFLREGGPVLVQRDLGVGLEVVNVERNAVYPSAASLRVAAELRRAKLAEELRLLYVAMTRARDHLILTGHVLKEKTIGRTRRLWRGQAGPLPEDMLMHATSALDWLLPAVASGGGRGADLPLKVAWDSTTAADAQVTVTLHMPEDVGDSTAARRLAAEPDERLKRILAGEPLGDDQGAGDPAVTKLLARVQGTYAFAAMGERPAVQTVTFLKAQNETDAESDESPAAAAAEVAALDEAPEETAGDPQVAERARARGIATHRILELLDFSDCGSEGAIDAQVQELIGKKRLTAEEADAADRAGILWVLLESQAGRRLVAAGRGGRAVRREIAFTWAAPPEGAGESMDPADWPTIRGVIDVLVADVTAGAAEVFDYKTDAERFIEARLPDYERQMRYYMRAATQILGYQVSRATLLFLGGRREHVVALAAEDALAVAEHGRGR